MRLTNVYLIRHCESEGNEKEIFYGITDCGITIKGQYQLGRLKKRFHEVYLDAIYTSPLKRAILTAEAVGFNKNVKIIQNPMLIEIDGGDVEGTNDAEQRKRFPNEHFVWYNDIGSFQAPNGESTRNVFYRMKNVVLNIVRENQGKTIAIVSHTCALYMLMSFLYGYSEDMISERKFWCDNASVSFVIFDEELNPKVEFFNDVSHIK